MVRAAPTPPQDRYVMKLYIAGMGTRSQRAIVEIRGICAEHLDGRCDLEVVDLIESPQHARNDGIVALPTLVRNAPPPVRRLVGDLSDRPRVLYQLDLGPRPPGYAA